MSKDKKIGLGKGLSTLFGTDEDDSVQFSLPEIDKATPSKDSIVKIEIDSIKASRFQPRQDLPRKQLPT